MLAAQLARARARGGGGGAIAARAPAFVWSASAFLLSLCICLHLSTVYAAVTLYQRARSRFYLLLVFVALAQFYDAICEIVLGAGDYAVPYMADWILIWASMSCYGVMNFERYRRLCGATHAPLVKVLRVATAVLCVLWVVGMGVAMNSSINVNNTTYSWMVQTFAVCYLYDGIFNATISFLFIHHLHTLTAPAGAKGRAPLRPGLRALLRRTQAMLFCESVLFITANVVQLIDKDLDPLWTLLAIAEAARTRVYCSFLHNLAQIMRGRFSDTESGTNRTPSTSATATAHAPRPSPATTNGGLPPLAPPMTRIGSAGRLLAVGGTGGGGSVSGSGVKRGPSVGEGLPGHGHGHGG
ncbi:hypothetical protein GGF31_006392 [Allomyces arbusculus]|nr:hypothetical protein GGF31_006392 [Allomyces arbusculus]